MSTVVFVILVGLIVAAVTQVVRRRRRLATGKTALDDAKTQEAAIPAFRIVALGPRGSGKTLLLSSMYHEMRLPGDRGYYLAAPHHEMLQLSGWFNQVADFDQDWPQGTVAGDTREFTFEVRTRAPSGAVHTVMTLGYLEYAGGVLTEPRPPGEGFQEELLERIRSADALFGIIDGFHLRQWIDGLPQGRNRLQHSLTTMVTLMLSEPRPITFVITKWDLLRDIDADEDGRLRMVCKRLMTNPDFRELVKVHSAHRVVRLIPVSAVGPDFAGLNSDGYVEKLPDGEMRPTNVDAPLSAVVPDIFEQVERQVDQARLNTLIEGVRRQTAGGPGAALAELGSYVARAAGLAAGTLSPLYSVFVGEAVMELNKSHDRDKVARQNLTERLLSEAEREMEEFRAARRRVMRELRSRVDVLEGRLPSSRLSDE
ncbi:MAG TPA: hypothetical protein VGP57_07280 [Actinoplanes sp.]|nr:hypothetical protein [Actinoplanes sp.]